MRVVYILPEVGMLTTLVYKLTGNCEEHMKTEKVTEIEQLICPAASRKETVPCRYEFHAVCNQTAEDVSKLLRYRSDFKYYLNYARSEQRSFKVKCCSFFGGCRQSFHSRAFTRWHYCFVNYHRRDCSTKSRGSRLVLWLLYKLEYDYRGYCGNWIENRRPICPIERHNCQCPWMTLKVTFTVCSLPF